MAVWIDTGVRRKMRIPAEWSARSEAEREQFAKGAAHELRKLYREERASKPVTTDADAHAVTFDDFARLWTSGDLAKNYPGHVKTKRTSADDVQKLEVMKPWIGDVPLRDFKIQHAEKVLAKLAEQDLAGATLRGYAQVIHRVLGLAVYPGKLLAFNPLPEGFLPDKGPQKAKSFLYPAEEAALLARRDVPIERRMLFGVLAREGLRLSEALDPLTWADVDLERGTVNLDENKTDDPRAWALASDVAEVLRRWRKLRPKAANVFDRARLGSDKRKLAGALRDDLALRVHDLRATFVTLALASGRSEA